MFFQREGCHSYLPEDLLVMSFSTLRAQAEDLSVPGTEFLASDCPQPPCCLWKSVNEGERRTWVSSTLDCLADKWGGVKKRHMSRDGGTVLILAHTLISGSWEQRFKIDTSNCNLMWEILCIHCVIISGQACHLPQKSILFKWWKHSDSFSSVKCIACCWCWQSRYTARDNPRPHPPV